MLEKFWFHTQKKLFCFVCVCVLILNLFRSLDPLRKKKLNVVFCVAWFWRLNQKNQGLRFVCMNGFTDIPRLRWCQIVSDIVQYWCTARVARWEIKSGQQETIERNSQQTVLSARCCKDILWMLYQRFETFIACTHPYTYSCNMFMQHASKRIARHIKWNQTKPISTSLLKKFAPTRMQRWAGELATPFGSHLPKPSPILSYLS